MKTNRDLVRKCNENYKLGLVYIFIRIIHYILEICSHGFDSDYITS